MERVLIVNTDDFGLSRRQDYGIVRACRNGVTTPTAALVNDAATDHTVQLSHDISALAVGMHFALTSGRPLTTMPGLTHSGLLGRWIQQMAEEDTLPLDEISLRLAAQYQRFTDLLGWEPTYLDSHHHVYMFPQVSLIVAGFAAQKGTTLRIDRQTVFQASDFSGTLRTSRGFSSEFHGEAISETLFLQMSDVPVNRGESSLEMMCHPASIDDIIRQSVYYYPRLTELDVLMSSSLKYAIAERGYRLGSFLNA